MAFSDPNLVHNPSTGTAAPAAWGDQVRDDLMAVYGPPRVRVHRSTSTGIAHATLVAVPFDVEDIDTHAMHSTVTNTERLTVPTGWGGDWMVGGTVQWEPNVGGTRRHFEILVNGSIKIVDADVGPGPTTGYATESAAAPWFPVAGDYFTLVVNHDAGSTINVQSDGYAGTIFWAYFIGSGAG